MNDGYIQIEDKFYQKSRVVILEATKYPENFHRLWARNERLCNKEGEGFPYGTSRGMGLAGYTPQHIYFLSNEEIKEGDWYIVSSIITNGQYKLNRAVAFTDNGCRVDGYLRVDCKKIIATTNSELTRDGFSTQGEPNTYIQISLPRPSSDFLNVFVKEYNKGNKITEVLVEYEEQYHYDNTERIREYKLKVAPDNTISIKPISAIKTSWNRDELVANLKKLRDDIGLYREIQFTDGLLDEWVEQNIF